MSARYGSINQKQELVVRKCQWKCIRNILYISSLILLHPESITQPETVKIQWMLWLINYHKILTVSYGIT